MTGWPSRFLGLLQRSLWNFESGDSGDMGEVGCLCERDVALSTSLEWWTRW